VLLAFTACIFVSGLRRRGTSGHGPSRVLYGMRSQDCRTNAEGAGMPASKVYRVAGALLLTSLVAAGSVLWNSAPAYAVDASPFEKLVGRWVGEGRLGVRDNATEQVKCRVTYLVPGPTDQLQQTIRCASASGSIEVRSTVTHAAGTLTGTWTELERKMH